MTRNRETKAQELSVEQLDLVAGGTPLDQLRLMFELLSGVLKQQSDMNTSLIRNARV
jgi:hypothetical protein